MYHGVLVLIHARSATANRRANRRRIRTQANEAPPPRKGLESELLDPSLGPSVHFDVSDEARMSPSARPAPAGHPPEKGVEKGP